MYLLNGVPLSPDVPFEHNGVVYPPGWLRTATPAEKAVVGVVEVVEQPQPDDFYGSVAPDPANPGGWIVTPYPADTLKARLKAYSRQRREHRELAGVEHTLNGQVFFISTDPDTRQTFFNYSVMAERLDLATRVHDFGTHVVELTELELLGIEQKLENRIHDCVKAQLALQAQIESGTVTTKEQIDAAYQAVA